MENKVLSYHPSPYKEYQLGYCKVDMSGKCTQILKVMKSKTGNVYCTFFSTMIDGEWKNAFSFSNEEYEKKFLTSCLEQVKPMMVNQNKNMGSSSEQANDLDQCPF